MTSRYGKSTPPRSSRRVSLFAAAGAGVLLLGALLIEAGFRFFVRQDPLLYQDSTDPELRFELKPGSAGIKWGASIEINEHGLRDRPILVPKPADEFRVMVVGDSCSFGMGVPAEDTFVRRIEALVRPPAGKRLRTVNLSMYHYNMSQKLAFLRGRGMRLEPDFLILQTAPDDWVSSPRTAVPLPRVKNLVRSRSAALRWLMEHGLTFRQPDFSIRAPGLSAPPGRPLPPAALPASRPSGPVARDLDAFARLIAVDGVPALVLYCPSLSAGAGEQEVSSILEAQIRQAARAMEFPYHDLAKDMKGAPEKFLVKPGLPHLNAEAHRIITEALRRKLEERMRVAPKRKRPVG